mmetsp:Transcript_4261/g.9645  ORF Transcript_4261/g.9645 Transcript_4261/m.9645 type:complete len:233 (+) Transcript_4261:91-789(+)
MAHAAPRYAETRANFTNRSNLPSSSSYSCSKSSNAVAMPSPRPDLDQSREPVRASLTRFDASFSASPTTFLSFCWAPLSTCSSSSTALILGTGSPRSGALPASNLNALCSADSTAASALWMASYAWLARTSAIALHAFNSSVAMRIAPSTMDVSALLILALARGTSFAPPSARSAASKQMAASFWHCAAASAATSAGGGLFGFCGSPFCRNATRVLSRPLTVLFCCCSASSA